MWLELLGEARDAFAEISPRCRPWFQIDRGADCWQGAPVVYGTRPAHDRTTHNQRRFTVSVNAVYVREINRAGDDRLEWMLLTTHPIRTRRDVLEVVRGYALRWRIEEFHRLWKTGLCCVEDTQLRSRAAIFKWATILASVATRAMRITHLARTTPDVDASTEFSPTELAALIALRQPKGIADDHVPTLAVAVRWIADLGGYTGPWNGLPGAIVIGRGLYDLSIAARAFEKPRKEAMKPEPDGPSPSDHPTRSLLGAIQPFNRGINPRARRPFRAA